MLKRIKHLEDKLDLILKVVMDIQLSIGDRGEDQKKRKEALNNYFDSITKIMAEKGADTSLFEKIRPILGIEK